MEDCATASPSSRHWWTLILSITALTINRRVFIALLSRTGRDRELVEFFEREYRSDLEEFGTRLRPTPPYLELAIALRNSGESGLFDEAMQRMRYRLDIFRAGGDVSAEHDQDEARYWSIQGNTNKALEFLEQAFAKGAPLDIFDFTDAAYDPLHEEPRFLALRKANIERINQERDILGYAPLTPAFYDRYAFMR